MLSTPVKIAFGYILLIALLFGAIGYIYRQMTLLTAPSGTEETIRVRKKRLAYAGKRPIRLSPNSMMPKSSGKPYVRGNWTNIQSINAR